MVAGPRIPCRTTGHRGVVVDACTGSNTHTASSSPDVMVSGERCVLPEVGVGQDVARGEEWGEGG